MPKRKLIQTIPKVPNNLPVFFDALVYEVLHLRRLGAETQSQLIERLPRQGLTAILDAAVERPPFNVTFVIELIPLADTVEVYLEAELMGGGPIRLMRGLLERMLIQMTQREIPDVISRLLYLESQNYGRPLQGSEGVVSQISQPTSQTNIPIETPPPTVIYCPACGLTNPAHARFCETCGTKLAL